MFEIENVNLQKLTNRVKQGGVVATPLNLLYDQTGGSDNGQKGFKKIPNKFNAHSS